MSDTKESKHTERPEGDRPYVERIKNTTKLQIKSLPFGTTKDELHDLCRRFGTIVTIEVVQQKGTAYVTFSKADEAQLAIYTLNGHPYKSCPLLVTMARDTIVKPEIKSEKEATPAPTVTAPKPGEKKPSFAQQQQVVKPKNPNQKPSFNATPQPESAKPETSEGNKAQPAKQQQQQPQQSQQQQQQGKKGAKGKNQQTGKGQSQSAPKEVKTFKVSVEKTTTTNNNEVREEGFSFQVSHQQYLDYIIPLLKEIQQEKEKENKAKNEGSDNQ